MGVQRQGAKINWMVSLSLIVAAGNLYRLKRLMRKTLNHDLSTLLKQFSIFDFQVSNNKKYNFSIEPSISEAEKFNLQRSSEQYRMQASIFRWMAKWEAE